MQDSSSPFPPTNAHLRSNCPCSLSSPCTCLLSLTSPQGTRSCWHSQSHHPAWMQWAGVVHCLRDYKFPLTLRIRFPRKDQFPAHPRDKSRWLGSGRCLLSASLMFQLDFPSLRFTKQGGESGTCPLTLFKILLYQIMSILSREVGERSQPFGQWDSGTASDWTSKGQSCNCFEDKVQKSRTTDSSALLSLNKIKFLASCCRVDAN